MVLADPKDVEPDLLGVHDLFDEVIHPFRRCDRETGIVVGRGKAVDPKLQHKNHESFGWRRTAHASSLKTIPGSRFT